jgi:hypothetical protein
MGQERHLHVFPGGLFFPRVRTARPGDERHIRTQHETPLGSFDIQRELLAVCERLPAPPY